MAEKKIFIQPSPEIIEQWKQHAKGAEALDKSGVPGVVWPPATADVPIVPDPNEGPVEPVEEPEGFGTRLQMPIDTKAFDEYLSKNPPKEVPQRLQMSLPPDFDRYLAPQKPIGTTQESQKGFTPAPSPTKPIKIMGQTIYAEAGSANVLGSGLGKDVLEKGGGSEKQAQVIGFLKSLLGGAKGKLPDPATKEILESPVTTNAILGEMRGSKAAEKVRGTKYEKLVAGPDKQKNTVNHYILMQTDPEYKQLLGLATSPD